MGSCSSVNRRKKSLDVLNDSDEANENFGCRHSIDSEIPDQTIVNLFPKSEISLKMKMELGHPRLSSIYALRMYVGT